MKQKNYLIKLESIQDIDNLAGFLDEVSKFVSVEVIYTDKHCQWGECGSYYPPEQEIKEFNFYKKVPDLDCSCFCSSNRITTLFTMFPYYDEKFKDYSIKKSEEIISKFDTEIIYGDYEYWDWDFTKNVNKFEFEFKKYFENLDSEKIESLDSLKLTLTQN